MSQKPQHTANPSEPDPRRWIALGTLLIAGFMNLVDITIVNVALPSLQRGFGANTSQIEWIVAGYVLAFALGLLPFGRFGDILGRRRVFLIGVSAFTLMSAVCGLAPSIEMLVVARILQGVAGALMMPQVMAIMQNIFPPQERGTAFAMFGIASGLAAVTGPVLGGFLITLDLFGLDWRPIFLINLPIGVFAILAGRKFIPELKGSAEITIDWIGIAIAGLAVFFLVFPLIEGRTLGWPVWIYVMLAASLPGFVLFFVWERAQEKSNRSQLLPMVLWRDRNYLIGTMATTGLFSCLPGFFMVVALFFQTGFGLTPLQSGLTTIPFPVGLFIASMVSGRLGNFHLKVRLLTGLLTVLVGMIWMRFTILGVTDTIDAMVFMAPFFCMGFGMGLTIQVLFQAVLSSIPPRDAGSGSGGLQMFQQLGGALGVAVIGEIFFSTLLSAGRPDHAVFVSAAANAVTYDVVTFGFVIVLALFLRPPDNKSVTRSGPVTATVEA